MQEVQDKNFTITALQDELARAKSELSKARAEIDKRDDEIQRFHDTIRSIAGGPIVAADSASRAQSRSRSGKAAKRRQRSRTESRSPKRARRERTRSPRRRSTPPRRSDSRGSSRARSRSAGGGKASGHRDKDRMNDVGSWTDRRGGTDAPDGEMHESALCIPFVLGSCTKGNQCRLRHPLEGDVGEARAALRRKPCRFGNTCRRQDCIFRHDGPPTELAPAAKDPLRTPCRYGDTCRKPDCKFLHTSVSKLAPSTGPRLLVPSR